MTTCGCSTQDYGCAIGKQLATLVWCGHSLIESSQFPLRPLAERDLIWQQYQQAVHTYLWHCGYVDEREAMREKEQQAWR